MKNNLYKILVTVSLVYLLTMYFLGKNAKNNVLGIEEETSLSNLAEVTQTPTIIPNDTPTTKTTISPTEIPESTATSTASPQPSTTPTPVPTPKVTPAPSSEVNALIERFAGQYGVDANILRYIALCESGFRSNASNAGYIGLFQFGATTWKNLRIEIGEDINPDLRYSAEESIQTAAYILSQGKGGIWPNCIP